MDYIVYVNSEEEFLKLFKKGQFELYSQNELKITDKSCCYIVSENHICGKVPLLVNRKYDDGYVIYTGFSYDKSVGGIKYPKFKGIREFDYDEYRKQNIVRFMPNAICVSGWFLKESSCLFGFDHTKNPENKYLLKGYSSADLKYLMLLEKQSLITYNDQEEINDLIVNITKYTTKYGLKSEEILTLDKIREKIGRVDFKFAKKVEMKFLYIYDDFDPDITTSKTCAYYPERVRFDENYNVEYVEFMFILPYNKKKHHFDIPTLSKSLEHEIHHFLVDVEYLKTVKSRMVTDCAKYLNLDKINKDIICITDSHRREIAYLTYVLFEPSENTALASEIFGELKFVKFTRENIQDAIYETEAYKTYHKLDLRLKRYANPNISFTLQELYNEEDYDEHNNWDPDYDWAAVAQEYFNINFSSIEKFKKWFLNKARLSLNLIFREMCRLAALSYDIVYPSFDKLTLDLKKRLELYKTEEDSDDSK